MNFDHFFLDARIVMTVVSMLSFIGICYWAYSAARREDFDNAANLPFADEALAEASAATATENQAGESRHG
jgi:cytochrome c oxidase cbb3-type subunit 4